MAGESNVIKEEILRRVFDILLENSLELVGVGFLLFIRPPQTLLQGTKKTVFVNFMDYCNTMHRDPNHVSAFLLAEMGTSGTIDGQQRLVLRGRFKPKHFNGILRRYVAEYVMCIGCKSTDTIFHKENRLFFVSCEKCGSRRCAPSIRLNLRRSLGRRIKP